jgi:hypothetical protein
MEPKNCYGKHSQPAVAYRKHFKVLNAWSLSSITAQNFPRYILSALRKADVESPFCCVWHHTTSTASLSFFKRRLISYISYSDKWKDGCEWRIVTYVWKEAAVAYFNFLYQNFPGVNGSNHGNLSQNNQFSGRESNPLTPACEKNYNHCTKIFGTKPNSLLPSLCSIFCIQCICS